MSVQVLTSLDDIPIEAIVMQIYPFPYRNSLDEIQEHLIVGLGLIAEIRAVLHVGRKLWRAKFHLNSFDEVRFFLCDNTTSR